MKATYRVDALLMKKSSNMLKLKFLQALKLHCFHGVYDDEDLMNITYGSVDKDDKEDSDSMT